MKAQNHILKQFPLLATKQVAEGFVYLDSAATTQKPQIVIDATSRWYTELHANIHRGTYPLAEKATSAIEHVRVLAAQMFGLKNPKQIVFTSGVTAGINIVVGAWARQRLTKQSVILLTQMEHHANIVPWQQLAQTLGCTIRYWPITSDGQLEMGDHDFFETLFEDVALVACTHVSNVLGVINPVTEITKQARSYGAAILIDGAQAVGRIPVDLAQINPDFYVCSAHKMYGPTGVGMLVVHPDRFAEIKPFFGGGDMIQTVSWNTTTYKPMPWLLEAGTLPLAQIFALGAAIEFIQGIHIDRIARHDQQLTTYLYEQLHTIEQVVCYGSNTQRAGCVSFSVEHIHAHDVAAMLSDRQIAVRAGHHCAMPLHTLLGVPATVRMSIGVYTIKEDIDRAITALRTGIATWNDKIVSL